MELTSKRIAMRPIEPGDAGELLDVFRDAEVRRYLLDDTLVSLDWVQGEIASSVGRFASGGAGLWAVRLSGDARIVGFVGFREFFEPPRLQLLYGLLPEHWGRGLATEAARCACDFAFAELGFDRVEAATDRPNARSVTVLTRLGLAPMSSPDATLGDTLFFEVERGSWDRGPCSGP